MLEKYHIDGFEPTERAADAVLQTYRIAEERKCVDWTQSEDVQNRMKTDIEDYLFELQENQHILLSLVDIDQILDGRIQIPRERRPQRHLARPKG